MHLSAKHSVATLRFFDSSFQFHITLYVWPGYCRNDPRFAEP